MKMKKSEITQQCKYLTEEQIQQAIKGRKCIKQWAYICHDKDIDDNGEPKAPHWHIMLQFNDTQDSKYIAKWFGIEEQYVNRSSSKRFEPMLLYLIHANATDKYQYDATLVKANFDYVAFIQQGGKNIRRSEILEMIDKGIITEFNYTEHLNISEYTKYRKFIEDAFRYKRESQYTGSRNLDVIYISGDSGCGKTSYAKWLCKKKGYSFFITGSGEDILDGYRGQECIILDDIRSSTLKFSDFIKMLDNNTDSPVKSRFHNKMLTGCRLLIITTIYDMDNFYKLFEENDEPLIQFQRRCKIKLDMDENTIQAYQFDRENKKFEYMACYDNPVKDLIHKSIEEQRTVKELDDFLGMESMPENTDTADIDTTDSEITLDTEDTENYSGFPEGLD